MISGVDELIPPAGGINSSTPDINQIPAGMVERVEVLTGGASTTYGADAVAGVVNFVMRKVDGVEISAGVSAYNHKNSNTYVQGPAHRYCCSCDYTH